MDSTTQNSTRYELSDLDRIAPPMMVKAFLLYGLLQATDLDQLITSFREGLRNAVAQMPFMQGTVQIDETGKPYIQTSTDTSLELKIRHFSQTEHKSYSDLVENSFAADDLKPTLLLPELPHGQQQVCMLQLNVVSGGVILGFAMHHAAGDWTSMDAFLTLLCRGTKANHHSLSMPIHKPDLDRTPFNAEATVSSVSQEELLANCPGFSVVDSSVAGFPAKPSLPPAVKTHIYRATGSSIQNLKQKCTPIGVDYLSSYDSIFALLWTSITRVRLLHQPEKRSSQSISANPINLRVRDPTNATSQDYFGNAILPSWVGPVDVQSLLADNGISTAASLIRTSINESSVESVGHLTKLVQSLSPTGRLGIPMDFHDMDLLMNSWYSGKAENYDIGIGSPFAFRTHRPNTGACCLILPDFSHSSSRIYEVFVQLPVEEHCSLQEDPQFSSCFELLN